MKESLTIFLETCIISAINVFAVYTAAFNYKLSWIGVMLVMVVVSLLTALITHFFMSKSHGAISALGIPGIKVSEGHGTLLVAAGSSLAVLVFLTQRFNFPEALGISLLSGGLSSFLHHTMSVYL